ncbi:unnamed protein product [Trifolium pratense]|uniref:Uncharacterized protein n=1 Tax=Trifolium pratense TaxID=57577 RepID=A0ACB0K0B2_TRIPR|nr:unnamed protein product [Trifolium pratense]
MGCICSKGSKSTNEYVAQNHTTQFNPNKSLNHLLLNTNDSTARLISNTYSHDEGHKQNNIVGIGKYDHDHDDDHDDEKRISRCLSYGDRGSLIVVGWPSWLTSVAPEAIAGWIPRRPDSFHKLDKIGQGTYSSVYRARDLETNKIVALKKVKFANMDPESVRFMAREIVLLRRLDHPNVMKLEGMITSKLSGSLYLIFEYMEHDLTGLSTMPGNKFTQPQIKCYMQQILRGLEHCHSRGVMHRDIKGSNILLDNNGNLKIADFGLATHFQPSQGQPLTSRVVTLWYRPPELLLGATDYGVAVDLWSAGCILAELLAGKPIMPGRTEVEQLHKIFKLCGSPSEEYWKKSKLPHATIFKPQQPYRRVVSETFKDFPSSALSLLEVLLAIEPSDRGTASSALRNEFFTSMPLPCDPSTLPKYQPSKEFDARLREEEARRRRTANKGQGRQESVGRNFKESKVVPAPDANVKLQASIEKRRGQCNSKCISEKYNPEEEGGCLPLEPAKSRAHTIFSHSGQSMHPSAYGSSRNMNLKEEVVLTGPDRVFTSRNSELRKQNSYWHGRTAQLSRFSNSLAVRGDSRFDMGGDRNLNSQWLEDQFDMRSSHLPDGESNHLLDGTKHSRKKDFHLFGRDRAMGHGPKNCHINYSGPLFPPEDNLEEILKEHERQIQQAVRKARLAKENKKG